MRTKIFIFFCGLMCSLTIFRWTGSNTNPNNNDGQGRAGTDRSNVVLQRSQFYPEGTGVQNKTGDKHGHWGSSYPELVRDVEYLGFSKRDLMSLALLTPSMFIFSDIEFINRSIEKLYFLAIEKWQLFNFRTFFI